MASFVHPTDLIALRDFLETQRCSAAPWCTPQRAVDRLYQALSEKSADNRFWRDLKGLVSRLEDARVDTAAAHRFAALRATTVEKLVDDLRQAMHGDNGPRTDLRQWLNRSVTAGALLAFLLLGTAVGCDEDSDNKQQNCAAAQAENITGHAANVYCDLVQIVKAANISSADKNLLLDCLPELDAAYRAYLLDLFQTMNDQDLAVYLEGMTSSGGPCAPPTGDDDNNDNNNDDNNDNNDNNDNDDTAGH